MPEQFDEQVYNTLNGLYLPGWNIPGVENAFAEGTECMQLYIKASDAYERLCDKLGGVDEDRDVEIIFNSFLSICKILGLKMYHYGYLFTKLDFEEKVAQKATDNT